MGAGYLGGAYFFIRVLTAKEWHRVAPGFLPVTSFTWFMLAATILHWDRFSHGRLGFQLWIILYVITPLLVPFIWFRNRSADPVQPKPNDLRVPSFLRWFTGLAGFLFLAVAVSFFIKPDLAINLWSWKLTPLTARVMAGWLSLLAVGAIVEARDSRWSAWRFEIGSFILWQGLVLAGSLFHLSDFFTPLNWFLVVTTLVLIGFITLYISMESRYRALQRNL